MNVNFKAIEKAWFKPKKNVLDELEEYIIEEIDEAHEELNIILKGNDLDYKNECTKEFNCIKNALEILLDKIQELKKENENGRIF